MKKKVGVLRFPGTNCDFDVWNMAEAKGYQAQWLWHKDRFSFQDLEIILIPGGFSYGDYLRCGAMAARSAAMEDVRAAASAGTPILGICNGFQVLCESGLLEGALVRNESQQFIDDWVTLGQANSNPYFAVKTPRANLPVAHGEGRFYAPAETLRRIQDQGLIWWTYENNPNGSLLNIAGIMNQKRNVAALMPHPERALYSWMGGSDGWNFLEGSL